MSELNNPTKGNQMNWTNQPPARDGYYWVKAGPTDLNPGVVEIAGDSVNSCGTDNTSFLTDYSQGGELWAGPLKPPPMALTLDLGPDGWPKLTKPARVGNGTFGAGVSSRLVVEAAQRWHEYHLEKSPARSAEHIVADERARRMLWDMVNGPLGPGSDSPVAHGESPSLATKLWESEELMSLNAELDLTMDQLVRLAQATLKVCGGSA